MDDSEKDAEYSRTSEAAAAWTKREKPGLQRLPAQIEIRIRTASRVGIKIG